MRKSASAAANKKVPASRSPAAPTELVCLGLMLALFVLAVRIVSTW
jgi:hypothetical protein